ncbi:MAG TPA: HAD family hydrolase [Thermoanaerobaculia bacterium]|nr:HAD family hydrolase [Thermoanaerobaculia bacterium]
MTLKAICFDLWETLITNPPDLTRTHKQVRLERMAKILGQPIEKMEAPYRDVWDRCQELYWSRDKDVSCRKQIDHFLEAMQLELDEPETQALEEAYAFAIFEFLPEIVPGALELIRDLRSRGYRLGLISNTGRTPGYALRAILDRLGLRFDAMVFSNEHGECKPQRSIFEALRQALDVDFDAMLFVGDNLYVDVHGAMQCGMTAIHFVPPQRGTAVAPPVEHDLVIKPDATINDLRDLLPAIEAVRTHRSWSDVRPLRGTP